MTEAMYWPHTTMMLAGISCMVNAWMAFRSKSQPGFYSVAWAVCYTLIATLSMFYSAAFAVLIFTDVDRAAWSEFLTPISAVSFLIVWILPATIAWFEHLTAGDIKRLAHDT